MRKMLRFPLILAIILFGSLLVSCAPAGSGTGVQVSWPGLSVDGPSAMGFVSYNTQFFALNISNGTEMWRFPVEADRKVSFYAPAVLTADGQLILGSYNNTLYSLDPQTGTQNWLFDKAEDKYIGSVLSSNGLIFAPNNDGTLYALDSNGNLKWSFSAEKSFWAAPIGDGERVYAASMDRHVYALDMQSGQLVWTSDDLGGAVTGSFSINSGVIYAGTVGENLHALRTDTGEILWETQLDGWVWSHAIFSNGSVFVADQEGYVYSINAETGSIAWKIQPDSGNDRGIISTLVLVEDTLYFASQGGILYAVDPATGNMRWSKVIGGHIYSDLKNVEDQIIFAVNDFEALVVGLDLQGNSRWSFIPSK